MESLYWVFTLKCNDYCDHCYNDSGPDGERIETADLLKVCDHLPEDLGRIILSGGEPLTEFTKLLAIVERLKQRYQDRTPIWLQTNGDLLNSKRLKILLEAGVSRFDITSLDRYHQHQGRRRHKLEELFQEAGLHDANQPHLGATESTSPGFYAFWGANEELWLGGNWARGRALKNGLSLKNPDHNFCALWSGAKGFLDSGTADQEVHVQLYRLYPCCPTTVDPLGDVRLESVEEILDRYRDDPDYQALNQGAVWKLGEAAGVTAAYAAERIKELGDVCLWCDEYFQQFRQGDKRQGVSGRPARKEMGLA